LPLLALPLDVVVRLPILVLLLLLGRLLELLLLVVLAQHLEGQASRLRPRGPKVLVAVYSFRGGILAARLGSFNITSVVLDSLILHIDDVRIRTAQARVSLKHILLPQLVRSHVPVQRPSYPASSTASLAIVMTRVAVEAAAVPRRFTVPPLDLLVDKVLLILLTNPRLLELNLVGIDVLLGILVEAH